MGLHFSFECCCAAFAADFKRILSECESHKILDSGKKVAIKTTIEWNLCPYCGAKLKQDGTHTIHVYPTMENTRRK